MIGKIISGLALVLLISFLMGATTFKAELFNPQIPMISKILDSYKTGFSNGYSALGDLANNIKSRNNTNILSNSFMSFFMFLVVFGALLFFLGFFNTPIWLVLIIAFIVCIGLSIISLLFNNPFAVSIVTPIIQNTVNNTVPQATVSLI